MKNLLKFVLVSVSLFVATSCTEGLGSKDKDINVLKSEIDDAFLKGEYKGSFATEEVHFTFKDNNGLSLVVGDKDNPITSIENATYEIIKNGEDTEMIVLSGPTYVDPNVINRGNIAYLVGNFLKILVVDGNGDVVKEVGNSTDILTQLKTAGGLASDTHINPDELSTNYATYNDSGNSKATSYVAFPIIITGAFTSNGVKGLELRFDPSTAYFSGDSTSAVTKLKIKYGITGTNINTKNEPTENDRRYLHQ